MTNQCLSGVYTIYTRSVVLTLRHTVESACLLLQGPAFKNYAIVVKVSSMITTMGNMRCIYPNPPARTVRARAGATSVKKLGGLDAPIDLENGAVTSGPDLSVVANGMKLPNPFIIGSGPPGV